MPRLTPQLPSELLAILAPYLSFCDAPGAASFSTVSNAGLIQAASLRGESVRDVMCLCLQHNVWPLRFMRNKGFLPASEQKRLLQSHVAVIGCGGLGGFAALFLSRLGIGELTLCDSDVFDESNLNRQLFCQEDRLGKNKALQSREALLASASHMLIHVSTEAANDKNLPSLLKSVHVVIDCLDNLKTRQVLELAAHRQGLPFIHGAIAGLEGFALASAPAGKGAVTSLYGETPPGKQNGAEMITGIPIPTPAATAALQVMLAISVLLKKPNDSTSPLWHLDLAVPEIETLYW